MIRVIDSFSSKTMFPSPRHLLKFQMQIANWNYNGFGQTNIFGQKMFLVKKILGQKNFLVIKFLWVKNFWVKKIFWSKKNFVKKIFCPKIFWSKNYWVIVLIGC